ncbi:MAG: hypothetical protein DMG65_04435 [Candidatus Angelobacter sp. Gp1-AA117]|nr:MAG: hypothetical protein DMG65_04435 [Candidatus Angelobacter sp. Gp1-AA117]
MPVESVRIHIETRERGFRSEDPRNEFWSPLRNSEEFSNKKISDLEGKLCREFGPTLQTLLVDSISSGLKKTEIESSNSYFDFERFYMHLGPDSRAERAFQFSEAYSKYLDYRIELLRANPAIGEARTRIADATGMMFAAKILGYSSLEMGLSVGSIEKAAKVFNDNFDSFRVFLEAFVPLAFSSVFTEEFADQLTFDIDLPPSLKNAFEGASENRRIGNGGDAVVQSALVPNQPMPGSTRERAEWLWKLANGSLVVPLVLALIVMYFGMRQISEIHANEHETLKPILQHQLEVMREDRLRFEEDRQRFAVIFQTQTIDKLGQKNASVPKVAVNENAPLPQPISK